MLDCEPRRDTVLEMSLPVPKKELRPPRAVLRRKAVQETRRSWLQQPKSLGEERKSQLRLFLEDSGFVQQSVSKDTETLDQTKGYR